VLRDVNVVNFLLALGTGALLIALTLYEKFAQPCYQPDPAKPFTLFSPEQLTTHSRFATARCMYSVSILFLFVVLSILGPGPLKHFGVQAVEPSSFPLYLSAAFIGFTQLKFIGQAEQHLRRHFHNRACVMIALPKIAPHVLTAIEAKFTDTFNGRLTALISLCRKVEELIDDLTPPAEVDIAVLEKRKDEFSKIKKRAMIVKEAPANERERLAEAIGFDPMRDVTRIVAYLLIAFCSKSGFKVGLGALLARTGLAAEMPEAPPEYTWSRLLATIPITAGVLVILAFAATDAPLYFGFGMPDGWPKELTDALFWIGYVTIATISSMFFAFMVLSFLIKSDDIDSIGRSTATLSAPEYLVLFLSTYLFALLMVSLLTWFDLSLPWNKIESAQLLSSVLTIPQRMLLPALVPSIFALIAVRSYVNLAYAEPAQPPRQRVFLTVVIVAVMLAALSSCETRITRLIWHGAPADWSIAFAGVLGFILGASTMYMLMTDANRMRAVRVPPAFST
jgi:hypothetical protein